MLLSRKKRWWVAGRGGVCLITASPSGQLLLNVADGSAAQRDEPGFEDKPPAGERESRLAGSAWNQGGSVI